MSARDRYFAIYFYPGVFMPEETSRELTKPTFEQALAAAPDAEPGTSYFVKDGWYAVHILTTHEKEFESDNGEVLWVKDPGVKDIRETWIIGEKIHRDDERMPANTRWGDTEFYVHARCGNWQPADAYNHILSEDELKRYEFSPSS